MHKIIKSGRAHTANTVIKYPNPTIHGRLQTPENVDLYGRNSRQTRRLIPNAFSHTPSPPRRRKQTKRETTKKSKLEKPLSELTKHLDHIPIKDTETWVKRSVEERQKEVGNDGFIKRPSNSFILYRSAYADRCREYERSNNHQDISSMAGASWAIETPEVRKQYEDWAKLERENHQAAFPDYKFQPQTQEAKARKRKEKMEDDSLEDSELEDATYRGSRGATPASSRSSRVKRMRRDYREPSYTPSLGSDGEWGSPDPYPAAFQSASYYQRANPGKPMPTTINGIGPSGGYFQATSHPNPRFSSIGHVEDIMYQQHEAPLSMYGTPPPAGLPGMSHEELMGETNLDNGQLMFTHTSLDPDLLAYDQSGPGPMIGHSGLTSEGFQASEYLANETINFGAEAVRADEKWDHFDEQ